MTAQQDLQSWLEQHRQLEGEAAKAEFYRHLMTTLNEKDSDSLREGMQALKQSVSATRLKAEQAKPRVTFQVFPKSQEEKDLLQKLLERMNIPFKMSA